MKFFYRFVEDFRIFIDKRLKKLEKIKKKKKEKKKKKGKEKIKK